MGTGNPFAENPVTDPEGRALVLRAKSGDRDALEELVGRHQAWILEPRLLPVLRFGSRVWTYLSLTRRAHLANPQVPPAPRAAR